MVHVVDAASFAVTENILVGTRPRRFIFTPNEEELWVSAELSSEVYVIDPASNKVTEVMEYVPPGFRPEDVTPGGMAITQDGSKVLVTLGRANHIAIVDTATKQVLDYVLVGRRAWFVALSADDRTAIVVNGLSDDVTIVDVEGAKPVKSVPVGRVPYGVLIDD